MVAIRNCKFLLAVTGWADSKGNERSSRSCKIAAFGNGGNAEKKLIIKELIETIELYPRQKLSGQWIKTIPFKFPMYYNDNNEASCAVCFDLNGNFLPKKSNDESVVTLVRNA